MAKVLLISASPIDEKMAGPGLRYWEFAKHLSIDNELTLVIPNEVKLTHPSFKIETFSYRRIFKLIKQHEVIITSRLRLIVMFYLLFLDKKVVLDIFNLNFIEALETLKGTPELYKLVDLHLELYLLHFSVTDFIVCSNERHRDFWLGVLFKQGLITQQLYSEDSTLKNLIDVVPFGFPNETPQHNKKVLKGVRENIKEDDFVLLWAGGVWDWFDPFSLVKAMAQVAKKAPEVKLFFMSAINPDPAARKSKIIDDTITEARNLGLLDKNVFFNYDWVPFAERANYLLEADAGVTTYLETLETRFAIRIRFFDYFWAELPIICTKGDIIADLVEHEPLGITVEAKSVNQLAEAILELYQNKDFYEKCKKNIGKVNKQYTWDKVTKPLKNYCRGPWKTKKKNIFSFCGTALKIASTVLFNFRVLQRIISKAKILG